jgi:hypothetical protein
MAGAFEQILKEVSVKNTFVHFTVDSSDSGNENGRTPGHRPRALSDPDPVTPSADHNVPRSFSDSEQLEEKGKGEGSVIQVLSDTRDGEDIETDEETPQPLKCYLHLGEEATAGTASRAASNSDPMEVCRQVYCEIASTAPLVADSFASSSDFTPNGIDLSQQVTRAVAFRKPVQLELASELGPAEMSAAARTWQHARGTKMRLDGKKQQLKQEPTELHVGLSETHSRLASERTRLEEQKRHLMSQYEATVRQLGIAAEGVASTSASIRYIGEGAFHGNSSSSSIPARSSSSRSAVPPSSPALFGILPVGMVHRSSSCTLEEDVRERTAGSDGACCGGWGSNVGSSVPQRPTRSAMGVSAAAARPQQHHNPRDLHDVGKGAGVCGGAGSCAGAKGGNARFCETESATGSTDRPRQYHSADKGCRAAGSQGRDLGDSGAATASAVVAGRLRQPEAKRTQNHMVIKLQLEQRVPPPQRVALTETKDEVRRPSAFCDVAATAASCPAGCFRVDDAASISGIGHSLQHVSTVVGSSSTSPNNDDRTTLMLRNLPNNYTRAMLLTTFQLEGFAGLYDFVYLPIDFGTGASLGYAFLNLVAHHVALRLWAAFQGYSKWLIPSQKRCVISWGHPCQGLEANVQRYRNSPVMHCAVPAEYKPEIYANGTTVPFPAPTRKLRPPRVRGAKAMLGV